MNNSMFPILDGLAGLTRAVLDNASQKSWLEVEDMEREETAPNARPRNDRPSSDRTGNGSGNATPTSRPGALSTGAFAAVAPPAASSVDAVVPETPRADVRYTAHDVDVFKHTIDAGEADGVDYGRTGAAGDGHAAVAGQTTESGQALSHAELIGRSPSAGSASGPFSADTTIMQPGPYPDALSLDASAEAVEVPAPETLEDRVGAAVSAHQGSRSGKSIMPGILQPLAALPEASPSGRTQSEMAAGVAHSLVSAGPLVAAQRLHDVLRPLSPQDVAAFLDTAHALVAQIFVEIQQGSPASEPRAEDRPPAVRTTLALAHLAAAIESDRRSLSVIGVVKDLSAAMLSSPLQNDNMIFSGLAQAIGVGAGARLALVLARQLVHGDEQSKSRARSYLKLILSGFARLEERIDEAHADLIRLLGPLLIAWAGYRALPARDAVHALTAFVHRNPAVLEGIEPRLDRLEQAGIEALHAVRDLSDLGFDPDLRRVHRDFLASQSVMIAISTSRPALRELRYTVTMTRDAAPATTLEATRLMLTGIGFDAKRADFLADLSQIGAVSMLGSGWTALESFEHVKAQGRAFQRLLEFINGQYFVSAMPQMMSFEDDDTQF